jgi:hypothetical protein
MDWYDRDGPELGGGAPAGYVDVPFRLRDASSRTGGLPRGELPHAAHDCPPALAHVLSPAEFEAFMTPLDAVAQQHRMTHMAARVVSQRMGYCGIVVLLALIVASVAHSFVASERTGSSSRGGGIVASPIYVAAIVAAAALLAATVALTAWVSRRERAAAQAVRDALGQHLAPAMAARGVAVDVATVMAHAGGGAARWLGVGGGRFGAVYAVRFCLPPQLQLQQPQLQPAPMMMLMVGAAGPGGYGGQPIPVAAPLVGYPGQQQPQQFFFPASPQPGLVYAPQQQQQQQRGVPTAQYTAQPQGAAAAGGGGSDAAPPSYTQATASRYTQANTSSGGSGGASGGGVTPPPGIRALQQPNPYRQAGGGGGGGGQLASAAKQTS